MRSSVKFQKHLDRKHRVYTQAKEYDDERTTSGYHSPSQRSNLDFSRKLRLVPL